MAKEKFIDWKPKLESLERLRIINEILAGFDKMEITVTLRQLYYVLLSRGFIKENTRNEYSRLGDLLTKARMAGRVDWSAIEDRMRRPHRMGQFNDINDLVDAACNSYRLPRWKDQSNYIELWCEKDALSSVIQPICDDLHVTQMVNRGYSSSTAMYDAAKRIERRAGDRPATIIYLGDFDPSGEDMVRDIRGRLRTFGLEVTIRKLALTYEQVQRYDLPPNDAKLTDSRAREFIAEYGKHSYEVDAIPPEELQTMVRRSLTSYMDMKAYRAWEAIEEKQKQSLTAAAGHIEEK